MKQHRRGFRLLALAALLTSAATAAVLTTTTSPLVAAAPADKPNVVVFLLDDAAAVDMRYLKGVRDALGRDGLTFTNAVASNPLCCPARAQLMTGQASHNNGVLTNGGAYGGIGAMVDMDNTIAAWLDDAGYQTSYLGKYINGYGEHNQRTDVFGPDAIPTGWDHWDPTLRGVTSYWHFSTFQDCPTVDDTACLDRAYAERRYTTTVEKNKTLALIDQFHQDTEPFFLFDSWTAPHKDTRDRYNTDNFPKAPRRYHRASDATDFQKLIASKPSYNERDMSDKTPDMWRLKRQPITELAEDNYLGRVAALRSVDEAITQIIGKLKDTGEFDNTLFVFTSDNGFLNGEHRLLYKKWEFKESLDVPLVMAWPAGGIPVGSTDRSATLVDVPATILVAAGVASRRSSVDGVSLLDTVPTTVQRYQPTPVLIGSGRENAKAADEGWSYRGIQWGPYTWTRHWGKDGTVIGEQFYDLTRDPYQVDSQPKNPYYRKNIMLTMREYFDELKACVGSEECVPAAREPIRAFDPDHDGLWSWYERNHYGTAYNDPDTDDDGFQDGQDRYPLDKTRH